MKERPIIFSTESVRAILAGKKTQTRRVIKPQPEAYLENDMWWEKKRKGRVVMGSVYPKDWAEYSPFGVPGDRLWVREKWKFGSFNSESEFSAEYEDGASSPIIDIYYENELDREKYLAECGEDYDKAGWVQDDDGYYREPANWEGENPARWRSPLFMPRCFSRLLLEITAVRVERVQDISENDAISEGMLHYKGWQTKEYQTDVELAKTIGTKPPLGFSPKQRYEHLWDSLNAKRGFAWDTNPYVWVVEFKLLTPDSCILCYNIPHQSIEDRLAVVLPLTSSTASTGGIAMTSSGKRTIKSAF
jgi:hypothetical protein